MVRGQPSVFPRGLWVRPSQERSEAAYLMGFYSSRAKGSSQRSRGQFCAGFLFKSERKKERPSLVLAVLCCRSSFVGPRGVLLPVAGKMQSNSKQVLVLARAAVLPRQRGESERTSGRGEGGRDPSSILRLKKWSADRSPCFLLVRKSIWFATRHFGGRALILRAVLPTSFQPAIHPAPQHKDLVLHLREYYHPLTGRMPVVIPYLFPFPFPVV